MINRMNRVNGRLEEDTSPLASAVRYDADQIRSEEEKAQARANMGAISAAQLADTKADLEEQIENISGISDPEAVSQMVEDVAKHEEDISALKSSLDKNYSNEIFMATSDFKQGGYGRDGKYNGSAGSLVTTINPIEDWVDEIILSTGYTGILFAFDDNDTYYGGNYTDYVLSGGYYSLGFYFTDHFNMKFFKTAYKDINFYLCIKRTSGANLTPSDMTNKVKLIKKITSDQVSEINYGVYDGDLIGNQRKDFIMSIGHGGGYATFPSNTAPSFIEASRRGLLYVEGDVQYTSDGIPVMCHDRTINAVARNSDGTEISETIYISNITYAQANTYDWGIYKGSQFAGTKLLKFDEWILLCKQLSLVPCIELKRESQNDPDIHTQSKVDNLIDILKKYNMLDKCLWSSFDAETMYRVKNAYPYANVGVAITENIINSAVALDTRIGILRGLRYTGGLSYATVKKEDITQSLLDKLCADGIPLIEYFINSNSDVELVKDHAPLFGGYTDYAIDIGGVIKTSVLGT